MRVEIQRCRTTKPGSVTFKYCRASGVFTFYFHPDDITADTGLDLGGLLTKQITGWTERATSKSGAWYPVTVDVRRVTGMPRQTKLWVHEDVGIARYWFDQDGITLRGARGFESALIRSSVSWVQSGHRHSPALSVAG